MSLKRQYDMTSIFSMASMTDVIFLLLIFFMVTSTFVFPTALEINLPQSSEQTAIKPAVRVYIDADKAMYVSTPEVMDPQPVDSLPQLMGFLRVIEQQAVEAGEDANIAIYADESVTYGQLVEVLNAGDRKSTRLNSSHRT